MSKTDRLEKEVTEARRTIAADGYPMSIGEITTLYRDGELIIRPEFQRLFRWTPLQKSRLVESILLGIPLPSIFVSQRKDGKWELVDGLQRISTILQLQNELMDENGVKEEELVLIGTKYLPNLEGRTWDGASPLSQALKLDIRRSKVDVKILKRESSQDTKFDLFQRLNNYGTQLSSQEMRNALLVGASPDFFAWLQGLANHPAFNETVLLPENSTDERYDLELVLRFLVLHAKPTASFSIATLKEFSTVLDDESLVLAQSPKVALTKLEKTFHVTFDTIAAHGGANIFSRWNAKKNAFQGSFLNTAFEVFALGLGFHISKGNRYRTNLEAISKKFWTRPDMAKGFATGKSTESRLTRFVPLGRKLLATV
jgi:hypothetical protein